MALIFVAIPFPKGWSSAAVNLKLEHVSSRLHAELRAAVDESTYRLWLEPLRIEDCSADTILLSAPAQVRPWIAQRFRVLLQDCVARALGFQARVVIAERSHAGACDEGATDSLTPQPHPHNSTAIPDGVAHSQLRAVRPNPRLTFERFVIGSSNRLAHGAALTIAEAPGEGFNPLFICGPPGVGKTHLLHSISAFLGEHNPETVVCLTSSESFTNEFLSALQANRIGSFKARFRRVDVLLIDDIQFLERKTRTEEEFFHTFNALYEVGGQIVMTSDRPPRDLHALEARLRERFEGGLLADIHPPDLTTRTAILRKRVRDQDIPLADDAVVDLLAERVHSSVRALEGALIRVVAFGSLSNRPITGELAEEVLDALYAAGQRPAGAGTVTISEVQDAACKHFEVSREELLSTSRAQRLAWPRQAAMYLARELTHESLPAIGRHFGDRDHTTVLYACRRAHERLGKDGDARDAIQAMRTSLRVN